MTPGDKVICVDDEWGKCWTNPREWFSALPQKGRIYVVSACKLARNGEPMIQLVGISSPPPGGGFYPHRFRLFSEMKSTISQQKEIL